MTLMGSSIDSLRKRLFQNDGGLIPAGAQQAEQRTDHYLCASAAPETLLRVDLKNPDTREPRVVHGLWYHTTSNFETKMRISQLFVGLITMSVFPEHNER